MTRTSLNQTQGHEEKLETPTREASAEPVSPGPGPISSSEPLDLKEALQADPLAAAATAELNTSTFFEELENLRLEEGETQGPGVGREILTRVPVRRPGRKEFVQCHPDPGMTVAMALYTDDGDDGDGEAYVVTREMREVFGYDVVPTLLQLSIMRNGTVFIWPLKIPQADGGRGKSWHESAFLARSHAMKQWVKIQSDRSLGGYRVFPPQGTIPDPIWPALTFEEILEIALRDRIIKSMDHPIVRKYLGQ
jgi:hypothetical protein